MNDNIQQCNTSKKGKTSQINANNPKIWKYPPNKVQQQPATLVYIEKYSIPAAFEKADI